MIEVMCLQLHAICLRYCSDELQSISNLLLFACTDIHIKYLYSESRPNLIDLKQKFLHKWCQESSPLSLIDALDKLRSSEQADSDSLAVFIN